MPRHKTTKAPPRAIEVLIHELRSQKLPRASLLVEARRTLAARDKAAQRDHPQTAELRAIFEQRLREAIERPGQKSGSLLNTARLYEEDKAQQAPQAEWTHEDTLAAVERGLPSDLNLPFPTPVRSL